MSYKAFAKINKNKRQKLDDKTIESISVGYGNCSKGYCIYTSGKIIIARIVKFLEDKYRHTNEKIENQLNFNKNPTNESEKSQNKNLIKIEVSNIENTPSKSKQSASEPRRSDRTNKGVPSGRLNYMVKHEHINEPENLNDIIIIQNPEEKQTWLKDTQEQINPSTKKVHEHGH